MRRYGNEHAFKLEQGLSASPLNLDIYNNTVFLTDTDPDTGMEFATEDKGTYQSEIFNNVFIKINDRVGQAEYPSSASVKPTTINWNLYWKMNDDDGPLAGDYHTVGGESDLCDVEGWECNGVGAIADVGSDPNMHVERKMGNDLEGFGCINKTACGGVDSDGDPDRWKLLPGSQFWEPEMFVPKASSPVCGAGRSDSNFWAPYVSAGANRHVVDTNAFLDQDDIGAVSCGIEGTQIAKWNEFPFAQVWKSSLLASGSTPVVTITAPNTCPVTVDPNSTVNFCGTKTDADGAPPYTYEWDFSGAACPADQDVLCPGYLQMGTSGTCSVTLRITDRWGKQGSTTCSLTIGGGGGGCSDCSRCVCEQW